MGTVYRGEHEETGEFHAVKVLAPTYTDDDHFRGRFESEIRALLKLNHPNIVQLISYGQEDGMLFFSMELIEGNSLFQMQRKGHRFDWRQILVIARDVCKGLRHAHDRGIIHRDLKPGNLLMATVDKKVQRKHLPGVVKITDFGIAKSYGSSQNTGTNVLGTMDFMSPEQARGEPITVRSDLYSLGTVMFTLLSGKPPFASKSVEEGIHNLVRVPAPPVSSVVPDVPREMDELINMLMEKKPENRVPTSLALLRHLDELEEFLKGQAEAKTAERSNVTVSGDSFELADEVARASTTDVSTGKQRKRGTKPNKRSDGRTAEYSDHDLAEIRRESEVGSRRPRLNRPVDPRDNYFNTVTDHLRQQQESTELDDKEVAGWGKFPLLIALLAVVGLITFGLYNVLTPPSANQLYDQIMAHQHSPDEALKEINKFLNVYEEDPRRFEVSELHGIGKAIQFYNLLDTRSRIRGTNILSAMEKEFLKIVLSAETDNAEANRKMAAFVKFHSVVEGLPERDLEVLKHAESFENKIRNDARNTARSDVEKIRSAMVTAARSDSLSEKEEIYRSIVYLYQNVIWGTNDTGVEGQRLVKQASDFLDDLESR
jgi:serine/threonine-protein kinase